MNHQGTIRLETARLNLRRFEEKDAYAVYHNWAKHEACSRYFPWNPTVNIKDSEERVLSWIAQYPKADYYQWGIEEKENRELIGVINLHDVDDQHSRAETSYILSPKYWGRGFMTEALREVLRFAFAEVGFCHIYADLFEENKASRRVLEKCGMQYMGEEPRKYCKNGKPIDSIQYIITRI